MANVYKTARGKAIDLDKVKLTNETVVAVGNMKTNARGDLIGAGNQITAGRNQLMDQVYAVADTTVYSPNDPANFQPMMEASSAEKLSNLTNNLTVPLNQAPVVNDVATDGVPDSAPATRGSLASSLAKPATVKQDPLPDPRKPKTSGPSRI
jgi:hypothetical protein